MSTTKIVFVVLFVLLFIGMLALDFYISHDLKKPGKMINRIMTM